MFCKIVKGPQKGRMRVGVGRRLQNELATPAILVLLLTVTKKQVLFGPGQGITCKDRVRWLRMESLVKDEVIFKITVIGSRRWCYSTSVPRGKGVP